MIAISSRNIFTLLSSRDDKSTLFPDIDIALSSFSLAIFNAFFHSLSVFSSGVTVLVSLSELADADRFFSRASTSLRSRTASSNRAMPPIHLNSTSGYRSLASDRRVREAGKSPRVRSMTPRIMARTASSSGVSRSSGVDSPWAGWGTGMCGLGTLM